MPKDGATRPEVPVVVTVAASGDDATTSPSTSSDPVGVESRTAIAQAEASDAAVSTTTPASTSSTPPRVSVAVVERWERNFRALVKFKQEFGHCRVSCAKNTKYKDRYPGLGKWVSAMRQAYKAEKIRQQAAAEGKEPKVRFLLIVAANLCCSPP